MSDIATLRDDLLAEQAALDDLVSALGDDDWQLPTPSPGWSVGDQIGHLTYFDGAAAMAITDPAAFKVGMEQLYATAASGGDDFTLGASRALVPHQRLQAWRANRLLLGAASAALTDGTRIEWYGPSMGAKSFLTARLMEVWAHGSDIAEAVEATRAPTDRLRHIAQLGYITRKWSYVVRGETMLVGDVRVVLSGPSGATFTWGPDAASDTITGSLEDFCLVVTQRRHLDDTHLRTGELGRHWLLRAQAFAGGASPVRAQRNS